MKIRCSDKKGLIEAAAKRRPCDTVIKNVQIVNLFTGEIYEGNVGIYKGFIAHIECDPDNLRREDQSLEGTTEIDGKGKYLIPGLIDAHIHIESTMMTPRNFAEAVIPHGTTTVVTDPHEIANVYGLEAVKYMCEASKDLPMRQYILIPSCVPAVPEVENAGAAFGVKEIEDMLSYESVIGLAEVMDYMGVIENDKRMVDILNLVEEKDLFIQGHAPCLNSEKLSAYLCGGAISCHESRSGQEAKDKLRNGMFVDARESSISKNVQDIVEAVCDFKYKDYLTLCTDDREPDEILNEGHMNAVVNKAITSGMDVIDAIRSATLNTAREIGIKNLGAIAPGYVADLLLVDNLKRIKPTHVWYQGELVAKKGKMLKSIEKKDFIIENKNSVYVKEIKLEDLKIKAPISEGEVEVNIIEYLSLATSPTKKSKEKLPVKKGYLDLSEHKDFKYVAIINRHKGHETMAVGIVKNFGLNEGALGSTVSHDSHNLTLVYDDPEEALVAIKSIKDMKGGMVCVKEGEVIGQISLNVAGLMSTLSCEELANQCNQMKEILVKQGLEVPKNPLLRIVTLALPVIPEVKMSDLGMVDVCTKQLIPVIVE